MAGKASEYVVVKATAGEGDCVELVKRGMTSVREAERWLRREAPEGAYGIVAMKAGPITVKIEKIEHRRLTGLGEEE